MDLIIVVLFQNRWVQNASDIDHLYLYRHWQKNERYPILGDITRQGSETLLMVVNIRDDP
jgi:hypothetical protein